MDNYCVRASSEIIRIRLQYRASRQMLQVTISSPRLPVWASLGFLSFVSLENALDSVAAGETNKPISPRY